MTGPEQPRITPITGLDDLRPGDLMFGPIGGFVGMGVRLGHMLIGESFTIGRLNILHAAVVVDRISVEWYPDMKAATWRPVVAEAMPSGARLRTLTERHWTPEYAYCRPRYADTLMADRVAEHAREMVRRKVPYSFASYAALGVWKLGIKAGWLTRWINRRDSDGYPREAICSVFVDQALSMAGYEAFADGRPEQAVTPGHLAAELLYRHPNTVWGGASWDGPSVGPFTTAPK